MNKDYRLYYYQNGTLRKWGNFKKGHARGRHFYTDLSEIEDSIN